MAASEYTDISNCNSCQTGNVEKRRLDYWRG
jgi:hypothetical protein